MSKSQYNLCCEVLRRFGQEGILEHVVLIGSWCLLAYKDFFKDVRYHPGVRTRDVDILVPVPVRFDHKVDVEELLKDLDFVISYKGRDGYTQFVHQDLMLEFIVPERGRGTGKPFDVPGLGVNAQPLRFMDFLLSNTVNMKLDDLQVRVPYPVNFALLKLIVAPRRTKPVKKENDLRQAIEVLRALLELGEAEYIQKIFASTPRTWQKTIVKVLKNEPLAGDIITTFLK